MISYKTKYHTNLQLIQEDIMKKWITGFWIMVFIIVTVFSVFTS